MMPVTSEIRRGTGRFLTRGEGYFTRHSFSFGAHYDPDNVALRSAGLPRRPPARPGAASPTTRTATSRSSPGCSSGVAAAHRLRRATRGVVRPGEVQVLSAGSGVTHAEVAGPEGPTRFVQAWLTPDEPGTPPAYSVTPVDLAPGELTGGRHPRSARARPSGSPGSAAGDTVTLPDDPRQHVFVAGGALVRSSMAEPLSDGDAFRITDQPGPRGHRRRAHRAAGLVLRLSASACRRCNARLSGPCALTTGWVEP